MLEAHFAGTSSEDDGGWSMELVGKGIRSHRTFNSSQPLLPPAKSESSRIRMAIGEFLLILLLAFVIELINASLGMGWGTIFTPILILLGFPAIVAVPAVLLSQGLGSIAASVFHAKFENASFEPGSIELKMAAHFSR
jgi:hypothetical protein